MIYSLIEQQIHRVLEVRNGMVPSRLGDVWAPRLGELSTGIKTTRPVDAVMYFGGSGSPL